MKKRLILFFLIFAIPSIFAQEGFQFTKNKAKISVPFKLINNLIFLPIKVNGVELNFLLDSGVEETILFSLEEKKEVLFFNTEKILFRGLGSQEAVEGLKSTSNRLEFDSMVCPNHMLYIILDPDFNLSSYIGIPVNGIIGFQFFRNNLVEINYSKKRIFVYKDTAKNNKKINKNFTTIPISIEKSKPYLKSTLLVNDIKLEAKLLLDIGNSDAIWLFQDRSKFIKVPSKNFTDFLGRGFSGDVEGKRARIQKFVMDEFIFTNPIAAFPDSTSIRNVTMVPDRIGSIGGEIMKRFTVIFNYQKEEMHLKKNRFYHDPFTYNKSGVEIQHKGLQWVQQTVRMETVPLSPKYSESGETKTVNDFKYKFQLKPIYEVSNVRKNSSAANSGLQKGDVIILINNAPAYKYSLQMINSMFRSDDKKWVTLEVERNSQILKFRFQLQDIL